MAASKAKPTAGAAPALGSVFNIVWLLHAALEGPLSAIALFLPRALPIEGMTAATVVILKLYASIALALAITCLLLYSLPDYLPGKRACAIMLLIYHATASSVLLNAPSFISLQFSGFAQEKLKISPESIVGCLHGFLALIITFWWQSTLGSVKAANGASGPAGAAPGGKKRR
ncbi:hypothetical protein IE53DRAFT_391050 [Violaceomyces palustris]|uniref:Uncharacterized protein n=1 Tax=Violaceomyces palustris TaxID=1673888 RepID=A0ACD0NLY6_9BASI|nr:hypothetical protein IE53DRAFT_391050 [Violaceomyces palustris]